MTSPLHHFAAALPKIELHIHLEGAILPRTVLALARRHGVNLPADDEESLRRWYRFTDFKHFIEIYLVIQNLLRTPEDFELVTYDFGREMRRQNIRYAETTFTPFRRPASSPSSASTTTMNSNSPARDAVFSTRSVSAPPISRLYITCIMRFFCM
jgi:adenosine deaminase